MKITCREEIKTYEINKADGDGLNKPELVYDCLKDDFNALQEEFYVLCLDIKNRVLEKKMIYRGTMGSINVNPSDVFRSVLLNAGNKFIIAHNHPSGDITPSEEDIFLTGKLIEGSKLVGLELLDHLVFTADGFTSLKAEGMM